MNRSQVYGVLSVLIGALCAAADIVWGPGAKPWTSIVLGILAVLIPSTGVAVNLPSKTA